MKATTVNKFGYVKSIVVFSMALIFGIAFLTFFLILNKPVPENYVETNATIIRIEENLVPFPDESDGIGPDDYEHHVFVEYSYNGETYSEVEYGNYDSSMEEGDKVTIHLNPDNPSDFMSDSSNDFVFVIVGIVIIIIGIGGLACTVFKKKKEKR